MSADLGPDESAYPTEEELRRVREWPCEDARGLMRFVRERWAYADAGYWEDDETEDGRRYQMHTAGWSGNEDLIAALQENLAFWGVCWVSSRRGGHHVFEVPMVEGAP